MNIFVVALHEPNKAVWEKLKAEYKNSYMLTDTLALVSPEDPQTLTSAISDSLGIDPENNIVGMVFKVETYYGYQYQPVWEWLRKAQDG